METIKFRICEVGTGMYLIKSNDIRTIYKDIAGGGCICSLDILIDTMRYIRDEVEKLGNKAVFVIE